MSEDPTTRDVVSVPPADESAPAVEPRPLSPAARRALAEAEARRSAARAAEAAAREGAPKELGGRGGLDPVRYEDWEIAGRAVDF